MRLRENAKNLHRQELEAKRALSREIERLKETDTFSVILPIPQKFALLQPPTECKVVKELLPNEKHLLKLYEKRERLK